jgi:hypothetical protein
MANIKYSINGKNVSDFGIRILSVDGIFDLPKRKIGYRHSWSEVSGEDIDLSEVALEPRIIKLDGIAVAESISLAMTNLSSFLAIIDTPGPKQLSIEYDSTRTPAPALTYLVFREEQVKVEKQFRFGRNVWKFSLTLQEYLPYKSIYRFNAAAGSDLSIQFTALARPVILFTGDGRSAEITDINTISIDYPVAGSYVVGVFSNHPSDFQVGTTNATFIWKL